MRSCYVPKIDKAIEATKDLIRNGRASKVYWAQNEHNRSKRLKLLNEIGDFMLVKSGGFLVPELARKCLSYYQKGYSVDEACLQAQKEVLNADVGQLQELWTLRKL